MKKTIMILALVLTFWCSSCKYNVYNYNKEEKGSNGVPKPIVNVTGSSFIENDLTKLYENTVKSVVTVLNYASYYDRGQVVTSLYGSGSGFVYSSNDDYIYLYTNAHVVSVSKGYNQSYYEIIFFNGYRSYGHLVYSNSNEDVAIMKVERSNQDFFIASIGDSDSINPGEDVFAIGSPLGLEYANTITRGIVSNIKVPILTENVAGSDLKMYLIQIDASLNPGNSGGPLFNMRGEVIGVNTLKIMTNDNGDDIETFNFSIPINHFVVVANSLIDRGNYRRPIIGISAIDIKEMTLSNREKKNIKINEGLYIESVDKEGISAGILIQGTIITKINDVNVSDMADFSCELYKYLSGEIIQVTTVDNGGNNIVTHSIVLR